MPYDLAKPLFIMKNIIIIIALFAIVSAPFFIEAGSAQILAVNTYDKSGKLVSAEIYVYDLIQVTETTFIAERDIRLPKELQIQDLKINYSFGKDFKKPTKEGYKFIKFEPKLAEGVSDKGVYFVPKWKKGK